MDNCKYTESEEKIVDIILRKSISFRKEVVEHKNNSNAIMYGSLDAKYSKCAKDVTDLISNLLVSLDNVEKVLLCDSYLLTFENIIAILVFSSTHLKLTDRQLTDLLFYIMKRNFLISSFEFNSNIFKNVHLKLKEHYFDKQKFDGTVRNLNENDVIQIKENLKILGLNKRIIEKIMKIIISNIQIPKVLNNDNNDSKKVKNSIYKKTKCKNLEDTSSITAGVFKTKKPDPILSKKEYYKIYDELLNYFSFDYETSSKDRINNSIMINSVLNEDDRLYCLSLLKKAKYDLSTIKIFLEKAFIYNKMNMNVLIFYNEIYEMFDNLLKENELEYYWLKKDIDDIRNIMLEMQLADDEEYCFGKELIKSIIDNMLETIPVSFSSNYYLKRTKILEKK